MHIYIFLCTGQGLIVTAWYNVVEQQHASSFLAVVVTKQLTCYFCFQEEAVQYVASTVDRLLIEQRQQGLKRVYVITTYVIGKERLLVAVHRQTGCKVGVTQQKLDTMRCLDLSGMSTWSTEILLRTVAPVMCC